MSQTSGPSLRDGSSTLPTDSGSASANPVPSTAAGATLPVVTTKSTPPTAAAASVSAASVSGASVSGASASASSSKAGAAAAGGAAGKPAAGAASGTPGEPAKTRELVQAIASDFYNVTDPEGKPVAGLLVLLDAKRRPVRAELHLGGSTTEESGRQAIRQAQHIIEERYAGPESLPLQVWQSFLRSEPLHVPLPPAPKSGESIFSANKTTAGGESTTIPWKPIAYGVGALAILLLLWWIVALLRGNNTAPTEPTSGGITVPVEGGAVGDQTLDPVGTTVVVGTVPEAIDGAALPPSDNAPLDILPGRRVRMVPGFTQPVLDQPGSGAELAELTPNTSVMVVAGPELLAGQADTIVWLEVSMGDGISGWVAANDSTKALLELAD